MKEYIATIIYICIFSIILELILPNGKLKKYIATIISLLVIITIISPVINFLKNEDVTEVISKTLDSVSNIDNKKNTYDFSDFQNKMVLTRTKENMEQDILDKCKNKFKDDITITNVVVELNTKYNIDGIKVYVENIDNVYTANKIMTYVTSEYNVGNEYIEVIQKETANGNNK